MTKPVSHKIKCLAVLVVLAVASLLIGGGCAENQLPVIDSLSLSATGEINPGTVCLAVCVASDPDEDELTYTWSADDGSFSGEGDSVSWTAPDEAGDYTVTVEVSDGKEGGVDSAQLIITVLTPNIAPVINSLTTDCPRVKKAGTGHLYCDAVDENEDELTYTWTAERGNISGEGSEVSWIAPGEYGTYLITVSVSDGRGGEATTDISIIVCSCGSACD